ncbi:Carbon monoxide dehydrogenase medium chain [Sporomusa carbonis]|uniref:FAD binding domain-containing protein n=1 Tax=Sporomusa carbonis TaxID=3076075 RepID=UPI003A6461CA
MVKTYIPGSLAEALAIKREHQAIAFAGGTDIMVRHRGGPGILPEFMQPVMFIGQLEELKQVSLAAGRLAIGAACTLSDLAQHKDVPDILKQALRVMASPAVRNMGTLGGNICNASPAGDTLPPLYALEASVVIENLESRREVPIQNFILGPGRVALQPDELLVAVNIPLAEYNVYFYKKVGTRKAEALAKLSFAGLAVTSENTVKDLRLAFGAVAPTVVKAQDIERLCIEKSIAELPGLLPELIHRYSVLIRPIDDQRSSARYRKAVSLNLLQHFITKCIW